MVRLVRAEIAGEFGLKRLVDFIREMHQQNIFSRNGAVGFQLKAPIGIGMLKGEQCIPGSDNALFQLLLPVSIPAGARGSTTLWPSLTTDRSKPFAR